MAEMKRFGAGVTAALLVVVGCGVGLPEIPVAHAATQTLQNQIDAQQSEIAQLNAEIAKYEAAIQQAGADKATLQAAIQSLDLQKQKVQAQVSATQHQINATQLELSQIKADISATQDAVDADQAALASDVRSIQRTDDQPLIVQLFSTGTLADAWNDTDATLQVQSAVQDKVKELQTQEAQLASARAASEAKKSALSTQKQTLTSQQTSLTQTARAKAELLAQTDAKQSNYEQLLAKAKEELASFSTFAANAGGSGLLANQTSCDSWGCYYNQRDTAWGNLPLDGTKYQLKSDGCLVTAMAMVMTHYGYLNVTPVTINANPGNFAVYYPAYLLYNIVADGVTATRESAYIDATLRTGNPVVVGLHAYGGTHYVVLTSGAGGHYLMRDPYIANAKDVPFAAHYSMGQIFSAAKVVIE